jgi:hypothetical protein
MGFKILYLATQNFTFNFEEQRNVKSMKTYKAKLCNLFQEHGGVSEK